MESILHVDGLSSYYGQLKILSDIRFRLPTQSIAGLIGPNGAGKTTLIKSILGLVQTTGTIYFQDKILHEESIRSSNWGQIRGDIGYLPEQTSFYTHLSPKEFLEFTGNLLQIGPSLVHEKIRLLIDYFNLGKWENRIIQELSKGNRQRLSLATTFMQQPKLLLLDEPFNGLAPEGRQSLREIISEFAKTGNKKLGIDQPGSVLVSSHILSDLAQVCDYYLLMDRNGDIIWKGEKDKINKFPDISSIEELYLSKIKR